MTFQHRAGVRPYTSPCGLAESCVFAKQSLPPGHCDPFELAFLRVDSTGHTFFRSYGVNLPSSFWMVLSHALGCSPHLLVSDFGTGARLRDQELFLEVWNQSFDFGPGAYSPTSPFGVMPGCLCPTTPGPTSYRLELAPSASRPILLRPSPGRMSTYCAVLGPRLSTSIPLRS